jgi:outer membrane protein assembly factor BamE (lipoprotein component of BamABCDE complex)
MLAVTVLPGALLAMTGCLVTSHSRTDYSGRYISNGRLDAIERGDSADLVIETLGEPSDRNSRDDGSEVWAWRYTRTKSSSGTVLLLFSGRSSNRTEGAAYVQLRDGVVEKRWHEWYGS